MQINREGIKILHENYFKLLAQQQFNEKELDYSILERHRPALQKLAETGNSVITVFDLFQKKHVYHSSNCGDMLGYTIMDIEERSEYFFDSKIHPEDYLALLQNGITLLKLLINNTNDLKINCKLISEYRILNASNHYTRVIEQQQSLELDNKGNMWLALSILDISPNQNIHESLKAQIINFKTGEFVHLLQSKVADNALTKREIEILKHVKEGNLSKEISDKLFISVHTVNTHRQRVLEKLNTNNSMEAIIIASRLGLI